MSMFLVLTMESMAVRSDPSTNTASMVISLSSLKAGFLRPVPFRERLEASSTSSASSIVPRDWLSRSTLFCLLLFLDEFFLKSLCGLCGLSLWFGMGITIPFGTCTPRFKLPVDLTEPRDPKRSEAPSSMTDSRDAERLLCRDALSIV